MGQLNKFIAHVLAFEGFEVAEVYWETPGRLRFTPVSVTSAAADSLMVMRVRRSWVGRCSGCTRRCRKVQEHTPNRRWKDLPWAGRSVVIEYAPDRLRCDFCERAAVELLPWAERYQRETMRFQQHMALQAQSMPTSHVAAQFGVDWHCVRRAEFHALQRWNATRPPEPLTMVGLDEKYLGRRHKREDKYITIVSNLYTGEPIWIGFGRSEATVARWLSTISDKDKEGIELFAMDMHEAFKNAVRADPALAHVAIAHDPFHVMKRALQAVDEVRRQVFFRAGPEMRAIGRGKRWLLLRAWNNNTDAQRAEVIRVLGFNRRLAHAYQVAEELREVLHAPNEIAMAIGLEHVMKRIERRDNVPMRKLHDSLAAHFEEIVTLGIQHIPTGRIEALNNNWETAVRQGRGYRNLQFLLLKVRFMTANPMRDDDGVHRFLALGLPTPYRAEARTAA